MTIRIRIPSSEGEEQGPADRHRPAPQPRVIAIATVLVTAVLVASVVSVTSIDEPDSSVPAPFEPSESDPAEPIAATEIWSERELPGVGEILAMGTVRDTPVAVVRSWPETFVWHLIDGDWQLDGSTDLSVEAAVVMDDRILILAPQGNRPTVWEWIARSPRYVFQPTTGTIVGMWSLDGRLIASVASSDPGLEQTIRSGRRDVLWVESDARDFDKLTLLNIESVLAVGGEAGLIAVGGRDVNGQAAVGFVDGDRVLANPVPGAPPLSAVTEFAGEDASLIARISVANPRRGTHDEVRIAGGGWRLIADSSDLVGVEIVDDVVVGVTAEGAVLRYRLDGEELPSLPSPAWSYGYVRGLARAGDELVAFGQSASGDPMFVGPHVDQAGIVLPVGRWERYHSEASDGFRLFYIGTLEFATRDGELFHRSWNAERWRPVVSDGGLVLYGTPRILEMDWGYVLIPAAGSGMWFSPDGSTWERVDGSDVIRIEEAATDGETLVGIVHLGAPGGPTSGVTVMNRDLELTRYSLPYHVIDPIWHEGIGFVGTVAPPESGYAISLDGIEWTRSDGLDRFERVVAFDGALFFGSGESVVEGSPPAETPEAEGWLFSLGETPAFQSHSGATWIHTGESWVDAALGVEEGLPARPHVLVVRGSRVYAMVEGIEGVAETYVLELD